MRIRHAEAERDAAACAAIYGPFVAATAVTFEQVPPSPSQFAARIQQISATHAFLVAEDDGAGAGAPAGTGVAGFAYAGPHRDRPGYRWACETSVYVHEGRRRRGVGRALYEALLPLLERQGLWVALAGITLPNPPSVALHEALGFRLVGVYEQIGWKAGGWRDVGWWRRPLREPEPDRGEEPPEPGPPVRLARD
jgi:phosphinothricin acetyltransferase